MKPSLVHYAFAHGIRIAGGVGAVALASVVAWACGSFSAWGIIAVIVALPLGCLLGVIFLWPVLHLLGNFIKGAPYSEGELVRVLAGPHRGEVGRIYEIWRSRHQVRVRLDERSALEVKDVFFDNEVCREREPESPS